jgi:hypothetical protein
MGSAMLSEVVAKNSWTKFVSMQDEYSLLSKCELSEIQLEELPECYQTDEPFEAKELDESLEGHVSVVATSSITTMDLATSNGQWNVFIVASHIVY